MVYNQLFQKIPPMEVCLQVLHCFGLEKYDCDKTFTRRDLEKCDCLEKLKVLKPILCFFYLPCKARLYLNDLNPKNCITILRHFARINDYKLLSNEKYIKGEKIIFYKLQRMDQNTHVTIGHDNVVVSFD